MNVEIEPANGKCIWCRKDKPGVLAKFPNEKPVLYCVKDFHRMLEMKCPVPQTLPLEKKA